MQMLAEMKVVTQVKFSAKKSPLKNQKGRSCILKFGVVFFTRLSSYTPLIVLVGYITWERLIFSNFLKQDGQGHMTALGKVRD